MRSKFTQLLNKNYRIETRMKLKFFLEIFLIVLFFVLVALNPVIKSATHELDASDLEKAKFSEKQTLEIKYTKRILKLVTQPLRFVIAYTPAQEFHRFVALWVRRKLNLRNSHRYTNEYTMERRLEAIRGLCALTFEKFNEDESIAPLHLHTAIRFPGSFRTIKENNLKDSLWNTRCSGVISSREDLDDVGFADEQVDLYLREAFLQVQHEIFSAWHSKLEIMFEKEIKRFDVFVRSFRHHTTKEICDFGGSAHLIYFLYGFSFMLPFLNLVWKFAREREANIFVQHWNYGTNYGEHWAAHFIIAFFHIMILNVVVIILIILTENYVGNLFSDVQPAGGVVFLLMYDCGLILSAMVFASLFKNAKNCVYMGIIIWFLTYGVFCVILFYSESIKSPTVFVSLLSFFNNSFAYGLRFMKNIKDSEEYDIYWLLIPMAINILISFVLLVIFQYRMPGRYMETNRFDFMGILGKCHKSRKKQQKKKQKKIVTILAEADLDWRHFQSPPYNKESIVQLKNIGTYNKKEKSRAELQCISVEFYEGEISVIVGHHGAGKTTLIKIMANWYSIDYGTIKYFGDDILVQNWSDIRKNVDVCMPINHLFDLLTIKETIEYYHSMKTDSNDELRNSMEIQKWLFYLRQITGNANTLIKDLTYQEQRLVALCCVLICDTKIILIDNPTACMPVKEQTMFWKIMQTEKIDRTIIMTTTSMDEAEILGDRIAILENGVLKAFGSLFFLQTNFDIGYDLLIRKKPNFDAEPIAELVQQFIPSAQPDSGENDEVNFKLPSNRRPLFQKLLLQLDKDRQALGIEHVELLGSEVNEIVSKFNNLRNNQYFDPEKPPKIFLVNEKTLRKYQFDAFLFKKILVQAPRVLPIVTVFLSIFLILFLCWLSYGLQDPPPQHQRLILGFTKSQSSYDILKDVLAEDNEDCRFFVIKELQTEDKKSNDIVRIFTKNSFECGKEPFTEYIKHSKTVHDKFGAIEFDGNDYIVWINQRILHSAPLAMNFLDNYIIHRNFDNKNMSITIENNPMPILWKKRIKLLDNILSHMPIAITFGVIMPLTLSCFVIPLAEERISGWYHLQRMAGMKPYIYWMVTLLWDSGTLFVYSVVYIIALSFVPFKVLTIHDKLTVLVLLIFYCPAALAITYLFSMDAKSTITRTYLFSLIMHTVTGLVFYILYWDVFKTSNVFYYIFIFFPNFALLDGISNIYAVRREKEFCSEKCRLTPDCDSTNICDYLKHCCIDTLFKFEEPGILLPIVFFQITCGLIFLVMFFVTIYRKEWLYRKTSDINDLRSATYSYDDREVAQLRKKIAEFDLRECKRKPLLVDQLEEKIPRSKKVLSTVSFFAEKGECVVFYGNRSSGKTLLVEQLVGVKGFSFGSIYVHGNEMKYDRKEAFKLMGYCPETRGLITSLTVRQHIYIMALIRGVPRANIPYMTETLIAGIDLKHYGHRRIDTLNEIIRRKVSIALAFAGKTYIIVLDEPTIGMPNYIKYEIWRFLKWQIQLGKTIILTTTDMMESRVMGNQVFIFHRHEIWAMGSANSLRSRYTKGFYVEVKIFRDGKTELEIADNFQQDIDNLNRFMNFMHSDSEQVKRNDNVLLFYVPVERVTYSYLYGALEKNRRRLNISEYTVRKGTMRDAMLSITLSRTHIK